MWNIVKDERGRKRTRKIINLKKLVPASDSGKHSTIIKRTCTQTTIRMIILSRVTFILIKFTIEISRLAFDAAVNEIEKKNVQKCVSLIECPLDYHHNLYIPTSICHFTRNSALFCYHFVELFGRFV